MSMYPRLLGIAAVVFGFGLSGLATPAVVPGDKRNNNLGCPTGSKSPFDD
jgi:hypothetical protein